MWTQSSFIEPRRRLRDMPDEIQPLYRLSQVGVQALSNLELLALALGGRDSLDLAETLLLRLGSIHQLARTSEAELQQIAGIGQAQPPEVSSNMNASPAKSSETCRPPGLS